MGRAAAPIEGLRRQRVDDGNQRHIRLLARSEVQAKGAVRGQVANEGTRQRLASVPGLFFPLWLGFGTVVAFAVLAVAVEDFTIAADAHAVDDGFAILDGFRLRLRCLVLSPHETTLDPNNSVMADDDERTDARDFVGIVDMALGIDVTCNGRFAPHFSRFSIRCALCKTDRLY